MTIGNFDLKLPKHFPYLIVGLMLAALVISYFKVGLALETGFFRFSTALLPTQQVPSSVAIVALDEASIQEEGEWPWSEDKVVKLLKSVQLAQAEVIGLHLPYYFGGASNDVKSLMAEIDGALKKVQVRLQSLDTPQAKQKYSSAQIEKSRRDLEAADGKLKTSKYWLGRVNTSNELLTAISRSVSSIVVPTMAYSADVIPPEKDFRAIQTQAEWPSSPWYLSGWLYWLFASPVQSHVFSFYDLPYGMLHAGAATGASVISDDDRLAYALPIADGRGTLSYAAVLAGKRENFETKQMVVEKAHGVRFGERVIESDVDFLVYPHPKLEVIGSRASGNSAGVLTLSAVDVLNNRVSAGQLADKVVLIGPTANNQVLQLEKLGREFSPVEWEAYALNSILSRTTISMPTTFYFWQRFLIVLFAVALIFLPVRWLEGNIGWIMLGGVSFLFLNLGLITMLVQQVWMPVILPLLFLITGYSALFAREKMRLIMQRGDIQATEARCLLGTNLQTQGSLDEAFGEFKRCPVEDDNVQQCLYQLGQAYERRRLFAKAYEVYRHISSDNPQYKDIYERMTRLETVEQHPLAPPSSETGTMILDDPAVEKPMLGRYELDRVLGRGAMGIVYLGRDPKIGRQVAIKTLPLNQEFEGTDLSEVKYRFYREAEASGRLAHPNIVTVYDVGEEHDLAYIAMDYVPGFSLEESVQVGKLQPVATVIDMGIQVAEALDYAHRQGVIHRDIKPGNIIFNPKKKQIKMTDFGIARMVDSSKTRTGTLLGTPAYMSPEQISGLEIDGRSDIFSLGVTLYHLLTGSLPFKGDSMANLVYQITNKPHPNILKVRAVLSEEVARVINKCLEKDPRDRYQSGANLAAALRMALMRWNSEERYVNK